VSDTKRATGVFFEQDYTCRHWLYFAASIFSLGLASMGGFWVFNVLPKIPGEVAKGNLVQSLLGLLLMFVPVPFLIGVAGFLNWHFWIAHRRRLRIDEQGITFGSRTHAWKDITAVMLARYRSLRGLIYFPCFTLKSTPRFHSELIFVPASRGLTETEAKELLNCLSEFLSVEYPRVDIGEDVINYPGTILRI